MCLSGEDALANLSIEKVEETGQIQGHVRIRSKTQGIALSLGDKITLGTSFVFDTAGEQLHLTFSYFCSPKTETRCPCVDDLSMRVFILALVLRWILNVLQLKSWKDGEVNDTKAINRTKPTIEGE